HGSGFLASLQAILASTTGRTPTMMVNTATFVVAAAITLDQLLNALGANAVLIFNLGWSTDVYARIAALAEKEPEGTWFVGGNILFNNNQVLFDALATTVTSSLCAVLLLSFDTVTMSSNQIECDLLTNFVIVDTLVIALSTQITANRFTESIA